MSIEGDPIATLLAWIDEAAAAGEAMPEAMTLATVSSDGAPSARMVLFKGISGGGLRFFMHLGSRKGVELDANPRAALLFYWKSLGRQVRVEGRVEPLDAAECDAYFASRPRLSQLSAAVSPQSQPIDSLEALLERRSALDAELAGAPVPRPQRWGGYRLLAQRIELWIGDDARLHQRHLFELEGGTWRVSLLAP